MTLAALHACQHPLQHVLWTLSSGLPVREEMTNTSIWDECALLRAFILSFHGVPMNKYTLIKNQW
jgi:hypothetical protein